MYVIYNKDTRWYYSVIGIGVMTQSEQFIEVKNRRLEAESEASIWICDPWHGTNSHFQRAWKRETWLAVRFCFWFRFRFSDFHLSLAKETESESQENGRVPIPATSIQSSFWLWFRLSFSVFTLREDVYDFNSDFVSDSDASENEA